MKLTPGTEERKETFSPRARTRNTLRIRNIWAGLPSCIVNLFISESDIPSTWFGKTEPVIKKIWFRIGITNLRIEVGFGVGNGNGYKKKGQRLQDLLNLLANLICRLQKNLPKSKIKAHQTHSALVIGFCKVIVYRPHSPFLYPSFPSRTRCIWNIEKVSVWEKGFESWVWDMHAKSRLTRHTKVLNDFCLLFGPVKKEKYHSHICMAQ